MGGGLYSPRFHFISHFLFHLILHYTGIIGDYDLASKDCNRFHFPFHYPYLQGTDFCVAQMVDTCLLTGIEVSRIMKARGIDVVSQR